ncbi:hypothetical protein VNI00_018955 [Paramarasmius palmivorus]|uniref:Uncharacterized protein n=1 Tax=Paramarasmius palmivorus TaxID=297713 RepID=A0AAW0ATD9_9AGAR
MEGLAITELEIITVGFAVLNFGTYFLWWNKPLRVRYPVRVYWRQQVVPERPRKEKSDPNARWISRVLRSIGNSIRTALDELRKALAALFNFFIFDGLNKDWENTDWTDAILLNLFLLPFLPLMLVVHLVAAFINIVIDEDDDNMVGVVNSSRLEDGPATLFFVVYGITTFFGAIHCIPWNFEFPTHTEQLIWRISASALVAVPVAMGVVALILVIAGALIESCWRSIDGFIEVLTGIIDAFLLPIVYIAARIALMVLALMELRKLPPSAYQTVEWTTFIPHIG